MIKGNHDAVVETLTREVVQDMLPGVHYLQDSGVEIEGVKFWGMPWGPNGPGFMNGNESAEMVDVCSRIPIGTHYLITHDPPFNILDLAWEEERGDGLRCRFCHKTHPYYQHWGSQVLRRRVREVSPLVHQFGHVHNRHATVMHVEGLPTKFVNASLDLDWRPTVFDLLV